LVYGYLHRIGQIAVLDVGRAVLGLVAPAAAHVVEIRAGSEYLADVVCHNGATGAQEPALLDESEVLFVEVLPMVEKDQVEGAN